MASSNSPVCPPRITLLGIEVDLFDQDTFIPFLLNCLQGNTGTFVANHNLHSIYLYHRVPEFQSAIQEADAVHIDGMPLVAWGRLLGHPVKRAHRQTYLDWAPEFLEQLASRKRKLAVVGGKPEHQQLLSRSLHKRFPNLDFQLHHGYFDTTDTYHHRILFARLETFAPDVLMVGMGMPRQEIWIHTHRARLPAKLLLPCGAFFEYLSDLIPLPHRAFGQMGLEWAARLKAEPRRLSRRYLIEPWMLIPYAVKDIHARIRKGG